MLNGFSRNYKILLMFIFSEILHLSAAHHHHHHITFSVLSSVKTPFQFYSPKLVTVIKNMINLLSMVLQRSDFLDYKILRLYSTAEVNTKIITFIQ